MGSLVCFLIHHAMLELMSPSVLFSHDKKWFTCNKCLNIYRVLLLNWVPEY